MKTIELTDEQYKSLLEMKNHISMKVREIPNYGEEDWEPKYTFGECIKQVIDMVWDEQRTNKVHPIT